MKDDLNLICGLSPEEVTRRFVKSVGRDRVCHRALAFWLVEVHERRLYQWSGHNNTAQFADEVGGIDARRARELVRIGRMLRKMEDVDAAYCDGRLSWSQLRLLERVLIEEHAAMWIQRAQELSVRKLETEVKIHKRGQAPRALNDRRGLPEITFKLGYQVNAFLHRKLELIRASIADETERVVDGAELLEVLCDTYMQEQQRGAGADRERRGSASSFVLHVRELTSGATDEAADREGPLVVETDGGEVPLDEVAAACVRCDALRVSDDNNAILGAHTIDQKTPASMRRAALRRDGHACRRCDRESGLMVHHIQYRSHGGRTCPHNLITVCSHCHSLIHSDSLEVIGTDARTATFKTREQEPIEMIDAKPVETDAAAAGLKPDVMSPDPHAFDGLIGHDRLVEFLKVQSEGCRIMGERFPHTLISGPAGTGKTTICRAIAASFGVRLHEICGSELESPRVAKQLIDRVRDGDMVFIDEIHGAKRGALERLYEALPTFTLLAATTHDGALSNAMLSRFQSRVRTRLFDVDELVQMAKQRVLNKAAPDSQIANGASELTLDDDAAILLAKAARGTPRVVLGFVDTLVRIAAARRLSSIDLACAREALSLLGYESSGRSVHERQYVDALKRAGRPMSLSRIARQLSMDPRTVEREVEPALIARGEICVTREGRERVAEGRVAYRASLRGTTPLCASAASTKPRKSG